MRTALAGLLLLGFLSGAVHSCTLMARVTDRFETRLNMAAPIRLIVDTGSGDIHLSRGPDDQLIVRSRFTVSAPDREQARQLAKQIKADPPIETTGQTIEIGDLRKYRNNLGFFSKLSVSITMSFEVQAPYETEVELNSGSGDQYAADLRGPLRSQAGSGDVEITEIARQVSVETGSGEISVSGASEVRAEAGSGDVKLEQISGAVEVNVGSGDVALKDIAADLRVDTGSGEIQVDSGLGEDVKWHLEASSGDVVLRLPAEAQFTLAAETHSGDIEVAFPLVTTGKATPHDLRGSVGEHPAAEIHIETSSGDIQINKGP